jgi:hypothetical protein
MPRRHRPEDAGLLDYAGVRYAFWGFKKCFLASQKSA